MADEKDYKRVIEVGLEVGAYRAFDVLGHDKRWPPWVRKEMLDKRLEAAENAIEIAVKEGNVTELEWIIEDETLPEYLRNEAKERMPKAVYVCIAKGNVEQIYPVLRRIKLPEDAMEEVGEALTDYYYKERDIEHLRSIIKSKSLFSESTRNYAKEYVFKLCLETGDYFSLLKMANDNVAPVWEARKYIPAAAERKIEIDVKEGDLDDLLKIAKNKFLPEDVRKKALEKAKRLCKKNTQ